MDEYPLWNVSASRRYLHKCRERNWNAIFLNPSTGTCVTDIVRWSGRRSMAAGKSAVGFVEIVFVRRRYERGRRERDGRRTVGQLFRRTCGCNASDYDYWRAVDDAIESVGGSRTVITRAPYRPGRLRKLRRRYFGAYFRAGRPVCPDTDRSAGGARRNYFPRDSYSIITCRIRAKVELVAAGHRIVEISVGLVER